MRCRRLPVQVDPALAARLREMRERAGLSQREAAERLGGTQTLVSLWERARAEPTLTALRRLAQMYGTTAAVLIEPHDRDNSTGTDKGRTVASMTAPPRTNPRTVRGQPRRTR